MKAARSGSPKMKAYSSFSEWKKDQSPTNQKLIRALEKFVSETAPHFVSTVKWGQGCWVSADVPKIYIHAEPDYVQLGFYAGSSLKDPKKLLRGSAKYVRHVKIRTAKDIDIPAFTDLLRQIL